MNYLDDFSGSVLGWEEARGGKGGLGFRGGALVFFSSEGEGSGGRGGD